MISDRDRELIDAAIDGTLDESRRAELEELLASSAEARAYNDELQELERLLKGIPELEPPASLHAEVMARARPDTGQPRRSPLEWLYDLRPGAGLRYALAAATGALVAAFFFAGGTPGVPGSLGGDLGDVVGTMAPRGETATGTTLDTFTAAADDYESRFTLRRSGESLLLDISTETSRPVAILVNFTGSGLWPDAVAQYEGRADAIGVAAQAVEVRASGRQLVTVLLRREDDAAVATEATIGLEISSNGNVLQRGTLAAPNEGVRQ